MARPTVTAVRDVFSVATVLPEFTEDQLLRLFRARPDLATPPPRDLMVVGARASNWSSINLCMITLNRACLQLLDALSLLPEATVATLSRLLGAEIDGEDLEAALGRLADLLLVVRRGDKLRVHPQIAALSHPAGLGPPAQDLLAAQTVAVLTAIAGRLGAEPGRTKVDTIWAVTRALSDPDQVLEVLSNAPAGAIDLAGRLADHPVGSVPTGTYNMRSESPVGWLAERGLVIASDWGTVIMPREVGLALRGGHPFPDFVLRPPAIRWLPVDAAVMERASTEQALRVVADIATILDGWQDTPAKLLKAGGIGIRDVRRAATAVGRSEVDAARLIELAAVTGLAGWDEDAGVALPRPAYDDWLALDVADRWVAVATSWLAARLHVNLAGALGTNEKPIPPLLDRAPEDPARQRRMLVLAAMLEAKSDHAADTETLAARVIWDAPPIWSGGPAMPPKLIAWAREEADMLGICASGALSTLGRALVTGEVGQAVTGLSGHAPRLTSQFVIQADLTAVATGPLAMVVRSDLELMADLESSGAATVYRFHEQSLRRAYDAGWTALEIVGFLEARATKGVPQPLVYLVEDVGRRHGRVRVGSATCYVRCDEPSLLTEILLARKTTKLGLRQLAPTVLVSATDPETVIATLRANGYLPGQEDETGDLIVRRQEMGRADSGHDSPRTGRLAATASAALAAEMASELARIVETGVLPAYGSFGPGAGAPDQADLVRLVRRLRPSRPDPVSASPSRPPSPPPRPTNGAAKPGPPPPTSTISQLNLLNGTVERPREIAKSAPLIRKLVEMSLEHEWWLRLGYTNQRGQTQQLNAVVLDIDDDETHIDVGTMPGHGVRTLSIRRISWARAMTPAEEEAL